MISVVNVIVIVIYGSVLSVKLCFSVRLLSYVLFVLLMLNVLMFSVDVRCGVFVVFLIMCVCSGGIVVNVVIF